MKKAEKIRKLCRKGLSLPDLQSELELLDITDIKILIASFRIVYWDKKSKKYGAMEVESNL